MRVYKLRIINCITTSSARNASQKYGGEISHDPYRKIERSRDRRLESSLFNDAAEGGSVPREMRRTEIFIVPCGKREARTNMESGAGRIKR